MNHRAMMLSALTVVGSLSIVALPAQADTGYRYWSYWNAEPGESTWRYATEGSGTHIPADGAVEGWRFGIAGDDARIQPTVAPDFASVCAGVDAPLDGKRVAVVIDTGVQREAPDGEVPGPAISECVTAATTSTGLQILQEVVEVRLDAGFICGIDGYPASECAPLVDVPAQSAQDTALAADAVAPTAQAASSDAGSSEANSRDAGTPIATAMAVSIAAVVGFAVWRRRSRVRA